MTRPQRSHATARAIAPSKEAFDTPLGRQGLPGRLGPATRRSGAYRDGTHTRRPDAACRTHHGGQPIPVVQPPPLHVVWDSMPLSPLPARHPRVRRRVGRAGAESSVYRCGIHLTWRLAASNWAGGVRDPICLGVCRAHACERRDAGGDLRVIEVRVTRTCRDRGVDAPRRGPDQRPTGRRPVLSENTVNHHVSAVLPQAVPARDLRRGVHGLSAHPHVRKPIIQRRLTEQRPYYFSIGWASTQVNQWHRKRPPGAPSTARRSHEDVTDRPQPR